MGEWGASGLCVCRLGRQETGQGGGRGALSSFLFYPIPTPSPGSCYRPPGTVKGQVLPHSRVPGPSTQRARCAFGEWMELARRGPNAGQSADEACGRPRGRAGFWEGWSHLTPGQRFLIVAQGLVVLPQSGCRGPQSLAGLPLPLRVPWGRQPGGPLLGPHSTDPPFQKPPAPGTPGLAPLASHLLSPHRCPGRPGGHAGSCLGRLRGPPAGSGRTPGRRSFVPAPAVAPPSLTTEPVPFQEGTLTAETSASSPGRHPGVEALSPSTPPQGTTGMAAPHSQPLLRPEFWPEGISTCPLPRETSSPSRGYALCPLLPSQPQASASEPSSPILSACPISCTTSPPLVLDIPAPYPALKVCPP